MNRQATAEWPRMFVIVFFAESPAPAAAARLLQLVRPLPWPCPARDSNRIQKLSIAPHVSYHAAHRREVQCRLVYLVLRNTCYCRFERVLKLPVRVRAFPRCCWASCPGWDYSLPEFHLPQAFRVSVEPDLHLLVEQQRVVAMQKMQCRHK